MYLNESKPFVNGNATLNSRPRTKPKKSGQAQHVASRGKTASLDIPQSTSTEAMNNAAPQGKRLSLSPGRAAHFSAQPIYETPEAMRHQPPPRSVSPAKSALKHSPSRGASPTAGILKYGRGPASEASDISSVISEEGIKAAPNRKKSVRVSFDNETVAVGRAASPPTDIDSPVIMSPQAKVKPGKKWLGFGK